MHNMAPMRWVGQGVRQALLAVQFYTRVPLPAVVCRWVGYSPAMQVRSSGHLPLVGALVGGVVVCVLWALLCVLPGVPAAVAVSVVFALATGMCLTGAMHEDALADTADGFGGGRDPERVLTIMKDPHTGAFGVVALVCVLALKASLWVLWLQAHTTLGLVVVGLAHVVSRWAPVCHLASLPYVRSAPASKAPALVGGTPWSVLGVATVWTGLASLCATPWLPFGAWLGGHLAAGLACVALWRLQKKRLGGCTGDTLGATQQLTEVAFLLGAALGLGALGAWG
jgi:adenosylcobinamide-GDP ribazoletransferase